MSWNSESVKRAGAKALLISSLLLPGVPAAQAVPLGEHTTCAYPACTTQEEILKEVSRPLRLELIQTNLHELLRIPTPRKAGRQEEPRRRHVAHAHGLGDARAVDGKRDARAFPLAPAPRIELDEHRDQRTRHAMRVQRGGQLSERLFHQVTVECARLAHRWLRVCRIVPGDGLIARRVQADDFVEVAELPDADEAEP